MIWKKLRETIKVISIEEDVNETILVKQWEWWREYFEKLFSAEQEKEKQETSDAE